MKPTMFNMRHLALVAVVLGLAALSPAPIDRTKDLKHPVPEVSQSTLESVQAGPIQPATPPAAVASPEPSPVVQTPVQSTQAERALLAADQHKAEEALRRASATIEEESPNPVRIIIVGAVCVALGAGIVALVRYYADKNLPAPKAKPES